VATPNSVVRFPEPMRLLLLALLVNLGTACATGSSNLQQARAAVREAHEASKAGDYKRALDNYERANALKPDPLLLFNVGQMARKMGNLPKAREAYTGYLRNAPQGQDKLTHEAQHQLALVEAAEKLLKPSMAAQGLVAVLELKTQRTPSPGQADGGRTYASTAETAYLTDVIRSAAAEAGLNVVTKENVVLLLKEQGHSMADCIDQCEVDTGRIVGADYVISGELWNTESFRVSLRLHDTVSGRFLAGVQASGANLPAVELAMEPELQRLYARIKAETPK
jgi:tetratricopeptide (TPR) repeat protein